MQIKNYDTEEEWMADRLGKITGTARIMDTKGKWLVDAWKILADKVALPSDGEDPRERGKRLELECRTRFEKETKLKGDGSLVLWVSDENKDMAVSPDWFKGKTLAAEFKCPESPKYLEVLYTQEIPKEYEYQKLQYFVINPQLKTLYFCFYNDRIPNKDFFYFAIHRKDIAKDIEFYRQQQLDFLEDINKKVSELTNF